MNLVVFFMNIRPFESEKISGNICFDGFFSNSQPEAHLNANTAHLHLFSFFFLSDIQKMQSFDYKKHTRIINDIYAS